jgi:hypothetical protein
MSQAKLHTMARGQNLDKVGAAEAELLRRQIEWENQREAKRKAFEKHLVESQIEANEKNAKMLNRTSRDAFWAAVAAATSAVILAGLAVLQVLRDP